MISVLILTFNEEKNIDECLKSVSWSDDVLVFDSFSQDSTVELARAKGARVLQRIFDDYGSQRQAALKLGEFRYPWLLVLDADERVDPELARELKDLAADQENSSAGYCLRRKDHFMGRWIPRSTLYPTWHLRLIQHARACYEPRAVHEHPIVDGKIGQLRGHLLHFSFSKGTKLWLEKHKQYAKLEAKEALILQKQPLNWRCLNSPDPALRRRALKALSYRLPLRGLTRFFYMFFIRLTILDGWPGLVYTAMISRYEQWVSKEMRILRRGHD